MPFKTNPLQLLTLLFSCANAVPILPITALPECNYAYTVTEQHTFEGDFVTGDYTVGGGKKS